MELSDGREEEGARDTEVKGHTQDQRMGSTEFRETAGATGQVGSWGRTWWVEGSIPWPGSGQESHGSGERKEPVWDGDA